jgi:hypothetical protein
LSKIPFDKFGVYEKNPFSIVSDNDFRLFRKRGDFKDGAAIIDDELVVAKVAEGKKVEIHDMTKFVKVYIHGLGVMDKLTNCGLRFYRYILSEVLNNSDGCDHVCLPVGSTLRACGYMKDSKAIYYNAVKELLTLGVLSKKECYSRNQYWINPNMFFNGNRSKEFKDNIVEGYFKEKGVEFYGKNK